MDQNLILVNEICGEGSTISDFEVTIQTNASIEEVFEVRHEILEPNILLGRNVIALFGKILVKIYYINSENMQLNLAKHIVNYKGFVLGEFKFFNLNPQNKVNSELEGIFAEIVESNKIKITGVVSTELIFSLQKVTKRSELAKSLDQRGVNKVYTNSVETSEGVYTGVNPGTNQEVTIILD